jgi:hypothetical protein
LGTVTKPSQLSHTLLNGVPVINNGIDPPHYWLGNTGVKFAPVTGWPASTAAALIVAYRYHLFAFDITLSGVANSNYYIWSAAAVAGTIPTSWTPAASNEAGNNQLSDTPTTITTARTLRDSLVVYKRNSAHVIDYIGGTLKFSQKGLWSKAGALSPRAVDDCNGFHIVVTEGDIVINDGYNQPKSIANALVRSFLFNQISLTSFEALQVMFDHVNQDVYIMFPEAGATYCTLALVYNIPSEAWGVLQLSDVAYASMGIVDDNLAVSSTWDSDAATWDSDTTSWNESTLTSAIDTILQAQPSATRFVQFNTSDAVATNGLVGKYALTFGEPERVKFVRYVHLRGTAFGTLYVRVGSQMNPDDATTWSNEYTVTSPNQPVPIFTQGRYISIEVRSTDTSRWTITGFDFEVEPRGYF